MAEPVTHRGGCHCGRVRFEVLAPTALEVAECDCSIGATSGFSHLIVVASRFTLLRGEESLTTYRFGTCTARHRFCRVCGIKSFYVPRSHPDGISVNARCLDAGSVQALSITPFDGRNWNHGVPAGASRSDLSRPAS